MRTTLVALLGLVVSATPAAALKCGSAPGDMAAVAATRAAADAACDANDLGCSTAPSHRAYVACVKEQATNAVLAGSLPKQCRSAVVYGASKSTCGKPGAVTCCVTNASGQTQCKIKSSSAGCRAPKGGAACVGSFPSCSDACNAVGCVTTTTTSTTSTTLVACGSSAYPACGGSCAAGLICTPQLTESPIGPSFPGCACTNPSVQCTGHPDSSSCEPAVCPPDLACTKFALFTCQAYACVPPFTGVPVSRPGSPGDPDDSLPAR